MTKVLSGDRWDRQELAKCFLEKACFTTIAVLFFLQPYLCELLVST